MEKPRLPQLERIALAVDNLTNNNLIDDMYEDYTIYRLKHLVWINKHELWKKWIRVV